MMNKYLFRNDHNGNYVTYQPFEIVGKLSQEEANKIILKENPYASRTGSSLDHLLEPLCNMNFIVKKYNSIYHKKEEYDHGFHENIDPLPDCMYSWPIIECISGNY